MAPRDLGLKAVRDYADIVENEAKRQGVDPDMVKAILYYENADGHKLGLDVLADTVGRSRSQRPMSIRSDMWGGLASPDTRTLPKTFVLLSR